MCWSLIPNNRVTRALWMVVPALLFEGVWVALFAISVSNIRGDPGDEGWTRPIFVPYDKAWAQCCNTGGEGFWWCPGCNVTAAACTGCCGWSQKFDVPWCKCQGAGGVQCALENPLGVDSTSHGLQVAAVTLMIFTPFLWVFRQRIKTIRKMCGRGELKSLLYWGLAGIVAVLSSTAIGMIVPHFTEKEDDLGCDTDGVLCPCANDVNPSDNHCGSSSDKWCEPNGPSAVSCYSKKPLGFKLSGGEIALVTIAGVLSVSLIGWTWLRLLNRKRGAHERLLSRASHHDGYGHVSASEAPESKL